MPETNATSCAPVLPKKVWQTPNIESFAVAEITENAFDGGSLNDGNSSNSTTTS